MASGPVRIKAYGLIEFTKAGYVKTQAVVLPLTVVLTLLAFLWRPSGALASNLVFGYLGWWFLLILIGETGETAIMLRKFREKEAALLSIRTPSR